MSVLMLAIGFPAGGAVDQGKESASDWPSSA
jgi:hypothetical protein